MIRADDVSLVVVTRGDVDTDPILAPYFGFGIDGVYVYPGGSDEDLSVYGRYAAIEKTDAPVIIAQDDDVILPPSTIQALLDAYEPGKIVCNVPERFRLRYKDSGMIGFGAIFDRDLPRKAFARFAEKPLKRTDTPGEFFYLYGNGDAPRGSAMFLRLCDIVFTMLTPVVKLDLPYTELPYARDESRMWRQPGHFEECDAMRKLCREVRDA